MNNLVKDLENCVQTLENLNTILKGSKSSGRSYVETEVNKKIEDGILDSIHNANSHQLSVILNGGYRFRFYTELNDKEKLRSEVQKRLRDKKLKELGL
jgi:3-dehydroquinate dehydratase